MTDVLLQDLGPVDYVVVELPAGASNVTGEMAKELLALVDNGIIRVIDVLILTKADDGAVEAMELSDVGELGELQALEAQLAELLAEADVEHLAAAMEPGSPRGKSRCHWRTGCQDCGSRRSRHSRAPRTGRQDCVVAAAVTPGRGVRRRI